MMEKYCVNCKWFDDMGKCLKPGDKINEVYGTRYYAYNNVNSRDLMSILEQACEVRAHYCHGDWFEPSRWARLKKWVKGLLWRNVTSKVCKDEPSHPEELEKSGTTSLNALAIEILRVLNEGVEKDKECTQVTFSLLDGEWVAQLFSPYLDELITAEHAGSIEEAGKELLELCRMLMEKKK